MASNDVDGRYVTHLKSAALHILPQPEKVGPFGAYDSGLRDPLILVFSLRLRLVERVTKRTEVECRACKGTGFPAVAQPAHPARKIFPAPCQNCAGKGRIKRRSTARIGA